MTLRRWLVLAAGVEVASLAILLINRATVHLDMITSSMGPIHGFAYLATIALAALSPIPRRAKAVAWLPVIGGLVAVRLTHPRRAEQPPAPGAAEPDHLPPADQEGHAIAVQGLTKQYRSGTTIGPVHFTVPRGQITGLIGPNGAGKTTVLRMLVRLVAPTGGTVTLDVGGNEDRAALGRVGALIESPALVHGLTGRRNMEAVAALAGWDAAQIESTLDRVGLLDAADQRVSQYSLGMRQRLALAITLLHDPAVVILDEPANGLDPHGIADLRRFLRHLADEGVTVLLSSHLLTEIEQVCDHVVLMDAGHITYSGPTTGLLADLATIDIEPLHAHQLRQLAELAGDSAEVGAGVVLVRGDRVLAASLLEKSVRAGISVAQMRITAPTLEVAFLRMTGTSRPEPGSAR
ncbi:ABC-2 type transport system ATP-binding protein [Microbacterium sp. AK009]|uniref:ABC transporter ATP-binding protein n=1 Tax=Microbacterium sp. AK009 TaxID=2723068 RepID=UPI0015C8FF2C|nr:ATP-binding cassette domain-containing protein [Microbacterium sp. AK009]NYF18048.1 ABC-2 type transport system ATP-binding protein [Microbacterium sp. AK009]